MSSNRLISTSKITYSTAFPGAYGALRPLSTVTFPGAYGALRPLSTVTFPGAYSALRPLNTVTFPGAYGALRPLNTHISRFIRRTTATKHCHIPRRTTAAKHCHIPRRTTAAKHCHIPRCLRRTTATKHPVCYIRQRCHCLMFSAVSDDTVGRQGNTICFSLRILSQSSWVRRGFTPCTISKLCEVAYCTAYGRIQPRQAVRVDCRYSTQWRTAVQDLSELAFQLTNRELKHVWTDRQTDTSKVPPQRRFTSGVSNSNRTVPAPASPFNKHTLWRTAHHFQQYNVECLVQCAALLLLLLLLLFKCFISFQTTLCCSQALSAAVCCLSATTTVSCCMLPVRYQHCQLLYAACLLPQPLQHIIKLQQLPDCTNFPILRQLDTRHCLDRQTTDSLGDTWYSCGSGQGQTLATRAFVSAAMDLRVPQAVRNFLSSCRTDWYSRKVVLQGVSYCDRLVHTDTTLVVHTDTTLVVHTNTTLL